MVPLYISFSIYFFMMILSVCMCMAPYIQQPYKSVNSKGACTIVLISEAPIIFHPAKYRLVMQSGKYITRPDGQVEVKC